MRRPKDTSILRAGKTEGKQLNKFLPCNFNFLWKQEEEPYTMIERCGKSEGLGGCRFGTAIVGHGVK